MVDRIGRRRAVGGREEQSNLDVVDGLTGQGSDQRGLEEVPVFAHDGDELIADGGADADPDDVLRALVGFTYGATGPGWEASARRLIDILMDGLRPSPQ